MNKRLKKVISYILAMMMVFSTLAGMLPASVLAEDLEENKEKNQEEPAEENLTEDEEVNDSEIDLENWMSKLPDDWLINEINMPGTHDSAARFVSNLGFAGFPDIYGKCQKDSISEQLNNGIRVLDIRLHYVDGDWRNLLVIHGDFDLYTNAFRYKRVRLEHVIKACEDFLKKHKDEAVFLTLSPDRGSDDDKAATYNAMYSIQREAKLHPEKGYLYYEGGDKIPTLKKVRGKIVFLDDYGNKATTAYENEYWNKEYYSSTELKEKLVRKALNESKKQNFFVPRKAKGDSECRFRGEVSTIENVEGKEGEPVVKCVLSSANGVHEFEDIVHIPVTPWGFSRAMNNKGTVFRECDIFDRISWYYPWQKGTRYGWVLMDYPTQDTIERIIATNDKSIYDNKVYVTVKDPEGAFGDLKKLKIHGETFFGETKVDSAKVNWLSDNQFVVEEMPAWPDKLKVRYFAALDLPRGWTYTHKRIADTEDGYENWEYTLHAPEPITATINWDCYPEHQDILNKISFEAAASDGTPLNVISCKNISDSREQSVYNVYISEEPKEGTNLDLALKLPEGVSAKYGSGDYERIDNTHFNFTVHFSAEAKNISGSISFEDGGDTHGYRPYDYRDFWNQFILEGSTGDGSYTIRKHINIPREDRKQSTIAWTESVPKTTTGGAVLDWKLSSIPPLDGYSSTIDSENNNVTYALQRYISVGVDWKDKGHEDERPEFVDVTAYATIAGKKIACASAGLSEPHGWATDIGRLEANLDISLEVDEDSLPEGYAVTDMKQGDFYTTFEISYSGGKYPVHVTNGSADAAEAAAGDTVALTADTAPAGMEFAGWFDTYGNAVFADKGSENTTFTMPDTEVWIQAVYRVKDVPADKHTVTVVKGSAKPSLASENEQVSIKADTAADGMEFEGWKVISGNAVLGDSKAEETDFTMPDEDVTLQALYHKKEVPLTEYNISVINGKAAVSKAKTGTSVWISADSFEGKEFKHWRYESGDADIGDQFSDKTFITLYDEDVMLEAVFEDVKYSIQVEEGIAKKSEGPTIKEAKYGEKVDLIAATPDAGKKFKKWEAVSGNIILSDDTASETSFSMPAENVKLKATYEDVHYKVDVVNGTANVSEALRGQRIHLTAGEAPSGKHFYRWKKNAGYDVDFDNEWREDATFVMPDTDVEVEAEYIDNPITEYEIHMTNGQSSHVKAKEGELVTVTAIANLDSNGPVFYHWMDTRGEIFFEDEASSTTTFIMPASEVWIQAVLGDRANEIHVAGGKADKTEANPGEIVSLTAGEAPAGMEFAYWMDTYGNIEYEDFENPNTTFEMPYDDVWIQAVYKSKEDPSKNHSIKVIDGTANFISAKEGTKVTITAANITKSSVFDHWVVVSGNAVITDADSAFASFVMTNEDVVVKAVFKSGLWTMPVEDQLYTGSAIKPDAKVYYGSTRLINGKDYKLKYANNVNTGFATITVMGKGNYAGMDSVVFNINPKNIAHDDVYVMVADKKYTGSKVTSKPVVKYNKKTLKEGVDYTVTYSENQTDKGEVQVNIAGKGNFIGTKQTSYKIYDKNQDFCAVYVDAVPDQIFSGERITLNESDLRVYSSDKSKLLKENADYTVTYENNRDVGTARAYINGIGEYAGFGGSKCVTFKIVPLPLNDAKIEITGEAKYTGAKTEPDIRVSFKDKILDPNYYLVKYTNNVNAAGVSANKAPTVTVAGRKNYAGKVSAKFTIKRKELTAEDVTVFIPRIVGDMALISEADIKPIVKYGRKKLAPGKDYELEGCNASTAKISFTGNYKGNIEVPVRVSKEAEKIIFDDSFTLIVSDAVYTGKPVRPRVMLIDNITGKKLGTNAYTISYVNNKEISDTAPMVTLTGNGEYAGTISRSFRIYQKSISKVYVEKIPDQIYTGSQAEPAHADIKVYSDKTKSKQLVENTDYRLEFDNSMNVGTGTVNIVGIGEYGAAKSVKFKIVPKGMLWYFE